MRDSLPVTPMIGRRLPWLPRGRKLYALGIAFDTALISILMSANLATPGTAAATVTQTSWVPLACLIAGGIPSHIGVAVTATLPVSVAPGQTFNLTQAYATQTLTPAAQSAASVFQATAFEGVVNEFQNNLTGATAAFAPGSSSPNQFNQVAAVQPPNSDAASPTDPFQNGPSPLQMWIDQNQPKPSGVFSFGPIPVNSVNPTVNTYGPAPGTGGGASVGSGTPDPIVALGPFTVTGTAPGTVTIGAGDASQPKVTVDNIPEVLVAKTHISFRAPTNLWGAILTADCGVDTSGLKVASPDPSFVSNFTIPIVGLSAPTVTTQPTDQTVTAGASAVFTAAASGNPAPTVQWQVSTDGGTTFTNVGGATSTTLTVAGTTVAMNADKYHAVFTSSSGTATSNAATLTVNAAPSITTQPADQSVTVGATATFTAAASGNPTPTVQWQVQPGGVGAFGNVAGATSATLSIPNTTLAMSANKYHARFTNSAGTATSNAATLTVSVAPSPPTVTAQPADLTLTAGATATFTAAASGNPAPTVQWRMSNDGGVSYADVTGATATTLTIPNTTVAMSGNQYLAVFTNSGGSATSNAAILTVDPAVAPAVTAQPADQTVTAGASAVFSAAASGNPAPTVQWQVQPGGMGAFGDVAGATSTTLSIPNTTLAMSANTYRAVFTNSAGAATTSPAVLTVNAVAPQITTQPSDQTVNAGGTASFTSHASGNPAPTVQWQVSTDGGTTFSNVAGANSDTLTVANTTLAMSTNKYRALFTNSGGPVTSSAATLTVNTGTSAPVVTSQPVDQAVTAGAPATFSASASGNPAPTVQWQISTTQVGGFTDIAGATSTTLTIPTTTVAMSGYQYRAVFTNSAGTATTNSATLSASVLAITSAAPALPNTGIVGLGSGRVLALPVLLLLLALLAIRFVAVKRQGVR